MPEGVVQRRTTIQWQELYPPDDLPENDDRRLVRVLNGNFNPFAKKFQIHDETIDLEELHGAQSTKATGSNARAQSALELNLRQRGVTPKRGSTCIDHAYANDCGNHMRFAGPG